MSKMGRPRKYDDVREARVSARISDELRDVTQACLTETLTVAAMYEDETPTVTDLIEAAFMYAAIAGPRELHEFIKTYQSEAAEFHRRVVGEGEPVGAYLAERRAALGKVEDDA